MATKKRRKSSAPRARRRRTTTALAPRKARRRSRRLSSAAGMTKLVTHYGSGLMGGGLYTASKMLPLPKAVKPWAGFAGSVALTWAGFPFMGAGMGGAAGAALAENLLKSIPTLAPLLNDEDFQDVVYVDPEVLSDTGEKSADGLPLVLDNNTGEVYAMDEDGNLYEEDFNLASDYDLQDAYQLEDSYNGAAMVPMH